MTIRQAITRIDALIPNTYSDADKIAWLSNVDRTVSKTIMETHADAYSVMYEDYSDESMDTELLAPAPYDDLYLRWLEAQIHYYNGESAAYNAAITLYNTTYNSFANWYNRTHMPLSHGNRFIF